MLLHTVMERHRVRETLRRDLPLYHYGGVLLPIGLLAWSFYTFMFQHIPLSYSTGQSIPFIIFQGIVYVILMGMTCISLARCALTDPGIVPSEWKPEKLDEEGEAELNERLCDIPHSTDERKYDGSSYRFCRICKHYKPDRCHHCSACDRCILKMDHHCVWVGNCVGFHNQKYFVLFLWFTVLTGFFGAATMSTTIFNRKSSSDVGRHANLMMNFLIQLVFALVLTFLAGFHMKLVLWNSTTLETLEKRRNWSRRFGDRNPYDVSLCNNFRQVFGEKKKWWFIPTRRAVFGDGIVYPNTQVVEEP